MPRFNLTWIYIIIAVALGILVLNSNEGIAGGSSKDVTYGQFKDYVSQGYASRIVADKEEGTVRMFVRAEHIRDVFKSGNIQKGQLPYVQTTVPSTDKLEDFLEAQSTQGNFSGDVTYNNGNGGIIRFLWSVGPLIFFIVMWLLIMRRMGGGSSSGGGPMGIFNVGRSRAQLGEKDQPGKVTFQDVAGQDGAKQEVQEIVEFLKNPKKYTDLGGKIPKGALLVGPPGTGKTMAATVMAKELGMDIAAVSPGNYGLDFMKNTFKKDMDEKKQGLVDHIALNSTDIEADYKACLDAGLTVCTNGIESIKKNAPEAVVVELEPEAE